jgi:hypothetical protein
VAQRDPQPPSPIGQKWHKSRQYFMTWLLRLIELYEFYEDESPLSSDETSLFNDPVKLVILLM